MSTATTSTSTSQISRPDLDLIPDDSAFWYSDPEPHATRVEMEVKEYWLRGEETDPSAAGGVDFAAGFEMSIGPKHATGASQFHSYLVTPGGLNAFCAAEGFAWGRHCLVFDRDEPGQMTRRALAYVRNYCIENAGSPEAAWDAISRLGNSEFEDINSGAAGRPRWHIAAKLLELAAPGVDLASFAPVEGGDFGLTVQARVGAVGGIEAGHESSVFEFLLCTPDWLARNRTLSEPLLCTNIAFMRLFDLAVLRRSVAETCADLRGYTASEAIAKMSRYARPVIA